MKEKQFFSLANIFIGKTEEGESFPQSIISVAEEVLVREIIEEVSYFEEYPICEDSDDEGEDEHTPSPRFRAV